VKEKCLRDMAESIQNIADIPEMVKAGSHVLILGGIREAADLAETLVGRGHTVISSLAGRTKEPVPLAGEVRIGGFGGADGLAAFINENAIDVLIDATHPFAKTMSANAVLAAEKAKCRLIIYARAAWQKQSGDIWFEVETLEGARDAIPEDANVLLALGSQHIAMFACRADVHFVVRMVDQPSAPLPLPNHTLIIGRPGDVVAETQLVAKHAISHIVCRNSGGVGAYAKIEAARHLNLPVIIINR
jgi:precorrin-6A/cobalt-precorrin-6A reductase